jgi:hypothetical protein
MPAEPQIVWMPGGVRTEIHLTGDDTDGAFCLLVDSPGPGWSLPSHIHKDAAETIHVVEGEFEMTVDGAARARRDRRRHGWRFSASRSCVGREGATGAAQGQAGR